VNATQIRFAALVRREINRFFKIKRQTLGAPLLETFLYISVFGAALGRASTSSRASTTSCSSSRPDHDGLGDQRLLEQLVVDPAAEVPALDRRPAVLAASPLQLLLAFSLGGFLRGMIVATLTFTAASFLVGVPIEHPLVLIPRSSSSASSSRSSACSSACAPSSSTTCRSRRRSCCSR
jgi:ABC-2 type transport system permease protein